MWILNADIIVAENETIEMSGTHFEPNFMRYFYLMIWSSLKPALSAMLFEKVDVKMVDVTFIPNSLQNGFLAFINSKPIPRPRYSWATARPAALKYVLTP